MTSSELWYFVFLSPGVCRNLIQLSEVGHLFQMKPQLEVILKYVLIFLDMCVCHKQNRQATCHFSYFIFSLKHQLCFTFFSSTRCRSSCTPCTSISLVCMWSGRTSAASCLRTSRCRAGREWRPSASPRPCSPPSPPTRTNRWASHPVKGSHPTTRTSCNLNQ